MNRAVSAMILSGVVFLSLPWANGQQISKCGCYCGKLLDPPCSDNACKAACGYHDPNRRNVPYFPPPPPTPTEVSKYNDGQASWNRGDYDQAFRDYNAAIAANQCYAPAHWGLAKVYVQMAGKWGCLVGQENVPCGEAAYNELRFATEGCDGNMQGLGPGDIDQINRMKDPLAKAWKERHYRIDAKARLARAKKYQEAGDLAAAESDYRYVIGLYGQLNVNEGDCEYLDAYQSLGDILGERGRYDEAIAALQAGHNTPCGQVIGAPGSAIGMILDYKIKTLRDKRDGVSPAKPAQDEPAEDVSDDDKPADETPEVEPETPKVEPAKESHVSEAKRRELDNKLPEIQQALTKNETVKSLDAMRGDIPRAFLLGWIGMESGGKFAAVSKHYERGYFQIGHDDWCYLQVHTPCGPLWNKETHTFVLSSFEAGYEKLCKDPAYSMEWGLKLVNNHATELRRLPFGFSEQRNPDLFWHMVKLMHATNLYSVTQLAAHMKVDRVPMDSWDSVREYVSGKKPNSLNKEKADDLRQWVQMTDQLYYLADKLDPAPAKPN